VKDIIRQAVLKKTQDRQRGPVGSHPIILDESGEVVWDILKEEQTLLMDADKSVIPSVFDKITAHVEQHGDVADYACFDFNGTMHTTLSEFKDERTARNIEEARDLSILLLEELGRRVRKEEWEHEILLLIKDGSSLFTIKDVSKSSLYMDLLTNMEAIITAGAMYGIKVFMEVDEPFNPEDHPEEWANIVTIS
jgi:hypothetical protein